MPGVHIWSILGYVDSSFFYKMEIIYCAKCMIQCGCRLSSPEVGGSLQRGSESETAPSIPLAFHVSNDII